MVDKSEKPSVPSKPKTDSPKPSPGLTRAQILKSLQLKPIGPVRGLPIVGKGGLKPFRPPPDGTKAIPANVRLQKNLRPPLERK
jgi:hypothetical protein